MDGVIVGQSGGPTAVINASLAGVVAAARGLGAERILGMRHGIKGLLRGDTVDLGGILGSGDDLERLKRTPAAFLGSCRYKMPDASSEGGSVAYRELLGRLDSLGVGAFLYIGGNDSMDTIMKLAEFGREVGSKIRFVGVPKTIDNDLAETDHTPGFGSAAKFIATFVREVVCDCRVYDVPAVTIVEVMGRNAGWLAASAALARSATNEGADLVYLPERPFSPDSFIDRVREISSEKGSVVVVVSEGIRLADGRLVCELSGPEGPTDPFGHSMMSGAGKRLEELVRSRLGIKCRSIEPSTLQRCAAHCMSLTDMEEAFMAGEEAVRAAARGESGRVSVFVRGEGRPYSCRVETRDVRGIANVERTVPKSWITDGGVTAEAVEYIRPLILGEVRQEMEGGVPALLRL